MWRKVRNIAQETLESIFIYAAKISFIVANSKLLKRVHEYNWFMWLPRILIGLEGVANEKTRMNVSNMQHISGVCGLIFIDLKLI